MPPLAQETQRAAAAHVTDLVYFEPQHNLILDLVTVRNLELVESLGKTSGRSLLDVIDETVTGMGARLLRSWLLRPSVKRSEVETRLDAVDELRSSQRQRDSLRTLLKEVSDLERLTGRINLSSVTPRDLTAIMSSLNQVPRVRQLLSDAQSSLLQVLCESTDELPEVRALIARAIADEPPLKLSDGDTIRRGYSAELDELRSISHNAKLTIASLEASERHRSGIGNLRIRYNGVFGYYIEISKSHVSRIPADYERRQTLATPTLYNSRIEDWEKSPRRRRTIIQLETECREFAGSGAGNATHSGTARAWRRWMLLASFGETLSGGASCAFDARRR